MVQRAVVNAAAGRQLAAGLQDFVPCDRPLSATAGVSAGTLFSNWSKIRHVADFLESTSGFAKRNLPRDRDRPVYFGKQPLGERAPGRLLVTLCMDSSNPVA